jgi:hypothetical protein
MNKLYPEHLHLLLDEPIYVLDEHFEGSEQIIDLPENEELPKYRGENKKGILIIIEATAENFGTADEEFLFAGLNALNIYAEDVAMLVNYPADENPGIDHNKFILFKAKPADDKLYQPELHDNITQLECHNISQIRNNQDLKVSFWLGLKAMFKA